MMELQLLFLLSSYIFFVNPEDIWTMGDITHESSKFYKFNLFFNTLLY